MPIPPKKERKYVECFRSILDGSCNWCNSRAWLKGNKIYAMKKEDGKWLACTDKKCYLEQGGKLTLFIRDPPAMEDEQPEIPEELNKHTPLDHNQYFACLDCGVSRIVYLWKHDNHTLRTLKDEEVT